jgi:hypothetical protein
MAINIVTQLIILLPPSQVLAASILSKNVTIAVPAGTRVYTNPDEICQGSSWTDILVFYLANYLAHIATVRTGLDPKVGMQIFYTIACLFFPAIGLEKSVRYILSCASLAHDPLHKAARAGALCHVVRHHRNWKPIEDQRLENCVLFDDECQDGSINGTSELRKHYAEMN